jgi:CheY-like chemotaxis protein
MTKILLVDDEPDIIYLVKKILEKGGYEVVEAYGGKEALKMTESEDPDLVLLDIMMPDLDGWDVSRTLKSREDTKHIPVVMLSVRSSSDSRLKSREYAHADAHIGKPASSNAILKTINSFFN